MIQSLSLLSLTLLPLTYTAPAGALRALAPRTSQPVAVAQNPDDAEYEKLKNEAGKDVSKLWKLHEWCKERKRDKDAKAALKAILKIDPNHKEANIAAGNVNYDGKWFPSQAKVDEYKKEKERQEKLDRGLVEWKGEWVPKEDLPYLEKGLVRDDAGNWVSGEDAQKIKDGWVKQDLDWVSPEEKGNIEKGLWKCGDKWLSLAEADKYHAEMAQWWRIPDARFNLLTTCDRDVAIQKVKRHIDAAYDDLEKLYGTKLTSPINVIVFRNQKQYSSYAAGDEEEQRPGTDALGHSSLHYAFFADVAFDANTGEYLAAGAGYWDASSDDGNKWGVHSVRHAIGQSFGEAIDPSPRALEKLKKTPRFDAKAFYGEKKIPSWFRYGAAAFAERYYYDTTVGIGGDHLWTRKWSVDSILKKGGLRPLKQIFEFTITADPDDARKLINESGLVVAFILDGKCAPVTEKFKAVQAALRGEGSDKGDKPGKPERVDKPAKMEGPSHAQKGDAGQKGDKGKNDKGGKGDKPADKGGAGDKAEKSDKAEKDRKALKEAFDALVAEVIKQETELRKFAGI